MKSKRILALLLSLSICISLASCGEEPCTHADTDYDGICDFCEETTKALPERGGAVGDLCYSYPLDLVDGSGIVNVKDMRGKVVVINFWGTWCGPCKSELPHFNSVAEEYADSVTVLTIHSVDGLKNAAGYIEEHFSDSKMIFAYDTAVEGGFDLYYELLGGTGSYPRTVILDRYGVITFSIESAISHDTLVSEVERALGN